MESQFTFNAVEESEIVQELKNLKWTKVSGLDNFSLGLLKGIAFVLTKPLTFIINLFLVTGVVPSKWKVAKVIPLSGWDRQLQAYFNSPYFVKDRGEISLQAADGLFGVS